MFGTSITERDARSESAQPDLVLVLGSGARVPLGQAPIVLGSSRSADVHLDDRRVSRRHARLEPSPRGLLLTDLDSSNGTFVRGVRVERAWIEVGDAIGLGGTTLVVRPADDHDAPAARLLEADSFGRLIGKSAAMRRLFAHASRLAVTDLPLLVQGETGTGKELLAEELHAASARASAPLLVFDAQDDDPRDAALSLFGAAPAVFPSLPDGREGLLEQARGGTLLLDEPEAIVPDVQRRLARALGRGETQRIGSEVRTPLDVRVIAVADRDLESAVERGDFREDLLHLLSGGRLELPPLRDRAEDIPLLVRHFWASRARFGRVPPVDELLVQRWASQRWPGNVRELETAVHRYLATGAPEHAAAAVVPRDDLVEAVLAAELPLVQARQEVVARFEERYIDRLLRAHDGNVTKAARASGLAHRYFQSLKARYGR